MSSLAFLWESRKSSCCCGLSAAVVVVQAQVVKHADEAANGHQIFIRPGKAAPLVREDEIEGADTITLCHRSLLSLSPLVPPLLKPTEIGGSLKTAIKKDSSCCLTWLVMLKLSVLAGSAAELTFPITDIAAQRGGGACHHPLPWQHPVSHPGQALHAAPAG